jgi:hypothetical protein
MHPLRFSFLFVLLIDTIQLVNTFQVQTLWVRKYGDLVQNRRFHTNHHTAIRRYQPLHVSDSPSEISISTDNEDSVLDLNKKKMGNAIDAQWSDKEVELRNIFGNVSIDSLNKLRSQYPSIYFAQHKTLQFALDRFLRELPGASITVAMENMSPILDTLVLYITDFTYTTKPLKDKISSMFHNLLSVDQFLIQFPAINTLPKLLQFEENLQYGNTALGWGQNTTMHVFRRASRMGDLSTLNMSVTVPFIQNFCRKVENENAAVFKLRIFLQKHPGILFHKYETEYEEQFHELKERFPELNITRFVSSFPFLLGNKTSENIQLIERQVHVCYHPI